MSRALHNWHIDQREYDRHEARRGRRHAYERIEGTRTALVVIDMVPFFVEQNAFCRGAVPRIESLASATRVAGGMVVWVVPDPATTLSDHAIEFYGPEVAHRYGLAGRSDDFGSRLWHEFVVGDKDLVVEKSASSAFFPGLSPLPDLLQDRGVDTVLISGTVTNVCCESSARDASTLGYRVIAVADAMAGVDDESHNASLRTIYRSFGDVRPTSEVVALFEGSQRALDVSSDS